MRIRNFFVAVLLLVLAQAAWAQSPKTPAAKAEARSATAAVQAKPARVATASTIKTYDINRAVNSLKTSEVYQQATAAAEKRQLQNAEFSILLKPGATAGGACVCVGGKGSLNGKPTDWGCHCDPAGCGSCGGVTSFKASD